MLEVDNVKYCGYCKYHFSKMVSVTYQGGSGAARCGVGGVGSGPGCRLLQRRQRWKEPGPCPQGALRLMRNKWKCSLRTVSQS